MNYFIIILYYILFISFELSAETQENDVHQKLVISEIGALKKSQISIKGNINTDLNFPNNYGISGVSLEYSKIYSNKLLLGFALRNNSGSLG